MHMKIGELARRTGLSVRMLHHYDAIGLLSPSARSDAGYRLYEREDIARLHAIQALRQIGLELKDIAALLARGLESLPALIQRQVAALETQIDQARELCGRLKLLQATLAEGAEPELGEWLSMLAAMSTYGRYFSAAELATVFASGKQTESQWVDLIAAIREAKARGVAVSDLELQALARRWMDLSVRMTNGNFELMKRWERMVLQEPAARGRRGDDLETVLYINQAVELRVQALLRHFSQSELQSLNARFEDEWAALRVQVEALMHSRRKPSAARVRKLLGDWRALVERTAHDDPALGERYVQAYGEDEVLSAGSILGPEAERFIRSLQAAGGAG